MTAYREERDDGGSSANNPCRMGGCRPDSSDLGQGPMTGTSEPGNDYSGSLKPREFLDKLRNHKLFKKGGLSSSSLHGTVREVM